jgi:hypothetical protein
MSKPSYVHNYELLDGGKKIKQQIMDGPSKGLSFVYLEKTDVDKDFMKILVRENVSGKNFEVTVQKGDKKDVSTVSMDELVKMVKKDSKLAFVVTYLSKRKVKVGRATKRKVSKKVSKKKVSKKARVSKRKAKVKVKVKVSKRKTASRPKKTSKKKSKKRSKK